jgi:hypothetical protein
MSMIAPSQVNNGLTGDCAGRDCGRKHLAEPPRAIMSRIQLINLDLVFRSRNYQPRCFVAITPRTTIECNQLSIRIRTYYRVMPGSLVANTVANSEILSITNGPTGPYHKPHFIGAARRSTDLGPFKSMAQSSPYLRDLGQ